MNNEEKIWTFLMQEISNPFGVAGLMGNMKAESNFNPCNLQNSYEPKLHYTDTTYTMAVDKGDYPRNNFIYDCAGYGLCQWTYWSRKKALYDFVKKSDSSIGDLFTQLTFMCEELRSYGLIDHLKNSKSVKEASDIILVRYEKPKDQSEAAKNRRAKMGEDIYNTHMANTVSKPSELSSIVEELEGIVKKIKNLI